MMFCKTVTVSMFNLYHKQISHHFNKKEIAVLILSPLVIEGSNPWKDGSINFAVDTLTRGIRESMHENTSRFSDTKGQKPPQNSHPKNLVQHWTCSTGITVRTQHWNQGGLLYLLFIQLNVFVEWQKEFSLGKILFPQHSRLSRYRRLTLHLPDWTAPFNGFQQKIKYRI